MNYDFTDKLKKIMSKLKKRDPKKHKAIRSKIREVINSGNIEHYKNLRYGLKHLKRVHIGGSFVFEYYKKEDKIMFIDYDHHDKIYLR